MCFFSFFQSAYRLCRILAAVFIFQASAFLPPAAATDGVEFPDSAGWVGLIGRGDDGLFTKTGWNHWGDGWFELNRESGVLTTRDGGGLLWYSVRTFRDFELELEYKCDSERTNSGVFLRIPEVPKFYDFIYNSFEIQIFDSMRGGLLHTTGAVYDAVGPSKNASRGPGQWNLMRITCRGIRIIVALNGETVVDWEAEPRGKITTFWPEGYIGLQNYPGKDSVSFRNIRIREIIQDESR